MNGFRGVFDCATENGRLGRKRCNNESADQSHAALTEASHQFANCCAGPSTHRRGDRTVVQNADELLFAELGEILRHGLELDRKPGRSATVQACLTAAERLSAMPFGFVPERAFGLIGIVLELNYGLY